MSIPEEGIEQGARAARTDLDWSIDEAAFVPTIEDVVRVAGPTVAAWAREQALTEAQVALATTEPTWHRGMYGAPQDMLSRQTAAAAVAALKQEGGK